MLKEKKFECTIGMWLVTLPYNSRIQKQLKDVNNCKTSDKNDKQSNVVHLVEKELNEYGATKKTLANANETFVNGLEFRTYNVKVKVVHKL